VKQETKNAIAKGLVEFAAFLLILGLNWWLVEGNAWLIWFLSSAEWSTLMLSVKVSDHKKLFDIGDRELVRVSALANSLEEKLSDLESELEKVKGELSTLEYQRSGG
jgi:hypothetical protein